MEFDKSREKRIADLEKENAELKKSVNNWLKYEKETQYHKSIIKDLKKENAELKEQIEKMKCCANCKKYWRMCEYGDREMQICDKWEVSK